MNIKQLEVFRAVLSTGSTMSAARSTGLSQSGVSRLIQQLESDLDLTLFQRVKGRLVPTPEARTLEEEAKTVLLNLARFSQIADEIRTGASETEVVRIGLPSSMWENFAPAMLKDYRDGFPGVRVETFFETTMTIQRMIDQRVIDFGFLRHEGEIGPGIRLEIVAEGRSVAVMHRDQVAVRKPANLRRDLLDGIVVLLAVGNRAQPEDLGYVAQRCRPDLQPLRAMIGGVGHSASAFGPCSRTGWWVLRTRRLIISTATEKAIAK